MTKTKKKIALALSIFLCLQPALFADSKLNKEIVQLELEITKMKAKTGDYANMSEKQLEKKLTKAQKDLEKKKAQAKKEAEKDLAEAKKEIKKVGGDLKEAGKDIKEAGKEVGKDLKEAGKDIGKTFKGLFD